MDLDLVPSSDLLRVPLFYTSLESHDATFPLACEVERRLCDPARPALRCALLRFSAGSAFLPDRIIVAPKSGYDALPQHAGDVALVYAFAVPALLTNDLCSLDVCWHGGVLDWGAIAMTRAEARALQPV
jgi:hypothetical protein